MSWNSIPNFGDPFAKINKSTHSSGVKRIEVLYGARDSKGNPTSPENESDGHGHWIALEIDGTYQMISWRHPQSEGAKQEYGKNRKENALKDLEDDIKAKEALCVQAEALAASKDWKNASSIFNQLFSEWKKIYYWRTPKENELWERFQAAKKTFYDRRTTERENNKSAKKNIITEARSLSNSNDWKNAGNRFKELFDKWKNIGSAGKDEDDRLWIEFNSARQVFNERRSKHFNELDEQREKNKQRKQSLITEARNIAQCSTDWKNTGDRLQELMDNWKAIGSAGKDCDDSLWNEFNGIRKAFFERRHIHYEQQDRLFQENASRKSQIIQEASSIASRCDYSSQSTERMKELDREWKSIGSAGKENDQLWNMFKSAKDSFWLGKRSYSDRRQQEWRVKTNEAISRKRTQISNLEQQISNLHSKMYGMKNQEYINNMCRWIDEKQAKIRDLEMAIRDMESRL